MNAIVIALFVLLGIVVVALGSFGFRVLLAKVFHL